MNVEKIEIPGSRGGTLAGRLETPDGPVRGHALFAHCFTCGKDSVAASRIARALMQHGIAVLRFDFTGIGASEGDFSSTNFSSNLDDLEAVAAYMGARSMAPMLLIGHSLGGAAVLGVAQRLPDVRAVVTIAAPSDPRHVLGLLGDKVARIEAEGELEVKLAGRPFRMTRQFVEDVSRPRCWRTLPVFDGRCWCCIRPPMTPWKSRTVSTSSRRRRSQELCCARWRRPSVAGPGGGGLRGEPDRGVGAALSAGWRSHLPSMTTEPCPDGLTFPPARLSSMAISSSAARRPSRVVTRYSAVNSKDKETDNACHGVSESDRRQ